jgi:hypothetical protein
MDETGGARNVSRRATDHAGVSRPEHDGVADLQREAAVAVPLHLVRPRLADGQPIGQPCEHRFGDDGGHSGHFKNVAAFDGSDCYLVGGGGSWMRALSPGWPAGADSGRTSARRTRLRSPDSEARHHSSPRKRTHHGRSILSSTEFSES